MRTLTRHERRTIMLGLCIVIPALVFAASRPYRAALGETREQLATQRDLLARELALLEDLERYPAAYRVADSALARVAPRLFEETDDVLATARLASYVAGQALSSRVLLQEAESGPTQRTKEGIRILEAEIRAEGDTEGILRFLQSLERGPRLVTVTKLALSRSERSLAKGRPVIGILTLTATVNGFALSEAPAAPGGAVTAAIQDRSQ